MKTKLDFVTNSSTTCFIAFGISIEPYSLGDPKYKGLVDKLYEEYKKDNESYECSSRKEFVEEMDKFIDIPEYLGAICSEVDLEFHHWIDAEEYYIGKSPFDMKEDETLSQFKEKIKDSMSKIGLEQEELDKIEIAYRD